MGGRAHAWRDTEFQRTVECPGLGNCSKGLVRECVLESKVISSLPEMVQLLYPQHTSQMGWNQKARVQHMWAGVTGTVLMGTENGNRCDHFFYN